MWWIANGDSREVLRAMADASVDSVVCDPPYELGFMGRKWDASGIAYDVGLWAEVLRVLKPGGHLLAFGGTRTYHRMACAIEDAGFEVRDSIHWIYGSGFPKSLDVSKAIDKAAGHWRGRAGAPIDGDNKRSLGQHYERTPKGEAITDAARQWAGRGTALKPAHEPIVVARKPLDGTVAANVLAHGTGAINVDGTRVGGSGGTRRDGKATEPSDAGWPNMRGHGIADLNVGRWPPNILLSHAPDCDDECAEGCAVAEMDEQSGVSNPKPRRVGRMGGNRGGLGMGRGGDEIGTWPEDPGGGASRFFPVFRYQAKASRVDRDQGLRDAGVGALRDAGVGAQRFNHHPTVKPTELMRWLVRLVTPPNGIVLDPFTGSGSTGVAAVLEGFRFAGVELSPEYAEIARARVAHAEASRPTTLPGLGVV